MCIGNEFEEGLILKKLSCGVKGLGFNPLEEASREKLFIYSGSIFK